MGSLVRVDTSNVGGNWNVFIFFFLSLDLTGTCKRGSVGPSERLLIPRSSVRFHLKTRELKFPWI